MYVEIFKLLVGLKFAVCAWGGVQGFGPVIPFEYIGGLCGDGAGPFYLRTLILVSTYFW